jgi:cell division protein FtsB
MKGFCPSDGLSAPVPPGRPIAILKGIPFLCKVRRGYNGATLERPIYRVLHLVFALGLAHALFLLAQEGVRAQKLAQERARLEAELEKKRAAIARLEALVAAAKDPEHLEALARRLGFVGPEEILKRR